MSRSYKKNPIVKDNGKGKKDKKAIANSRVRNKLKDLDYTIANGKAYRKEYESWDIADFVSRWTRQEAINYYNNKESFVDRKRFPTLESWLAYWKKCYKCK